MMVSMDRVKNGLVEYINHEFCSKLTDYRKWLLPLAAGMYLNRLDELEEEYEDYLKSMKFVDGSGMVDIDLIYNRLYEIADKQGCIKQQIPMIGETTFTYDDVNKVYRTIMK